MTASKEALPLNFGPKRAMVALSRIPWSFKTTFQKLLVRAKEPQIDRDDRGEATPLHLGRRE